MKPYIFPVIGIIGGALYSCYNYFHVILNGGVGKNGSTVAVSPRGFPPLGVKLRDLGWLTVRRDTCWMTFLPRRTPAC